MNVRVRSETTDPIPAQLYLTVGESDQATSGRVMEADLRDLMHGLPTNVPIMVCEDPHAMPMKGSFLPRDPYGLSQKHFKAGLELIIWPGGCLPSQRALSTSIVIWYRVFYILTLSVLFQAALCTGS